MKLGFHADLTIKNRLKLARCSVLCAKRVCFERPDFAFIVTDQDSVVVLGFRTEPFQLHRVDSVAN